MYEKTGRSDSTQLYQRMGEFLKHWSEWWKNIPVGALPQSRFLSHCRKNSEMRWKSRKKSEKLLSSQGKSWDPGGQLP